MSFGARGGGRGGFGADRQGRGGFGSNTGDSFGGVAGSRGGGQSECSGFGGPSGGGFNEDQSARGGGFGRQSGGGFNSGQSGRGGFGGPSGGGFSDGKSGRGGFGSQTSGGFSDGQPARGGFRGQSSGGFNDGQSARGGFGGPSGGGFSDGQSGRGGFGGPSIGGFSDGQSGRGDQSNRGGFNDRQSGRGGFGGQSGCGFNEGQSSRGGFSGGQSGRGGFGYGQSGRGGFGGTSGGGAAFPPPPRGFGGATAAGDGGFSRTGDDFGLDGESPPSPNNYIPEVRPVEELYREDMANAENYRQVADDDDDIHVSGPNIDISVRLDTWQDAGFPDVMLKNIVERSMYIRPRKIQAQVIPFVMAGRDVKGHAETGSGKTAAFMLPIIHKLMNSPNTSSEPLGPASPYAIIIEPTRELCSQVYEQGRKFAHETGVSVAKCYGQYSMRENLNEIRAGCNILCATTGRLKHFIQANLISTRNLIFFVLDEADTLLEANFLEDIREVINSPNFPDRNSRQTMLFSATFPELVQQLSSDVLRDDCVFVSNQKMVATNSRVIQCFELVSNMEKKDKLLQLLQDEIDRRHNQNSDAPPLCRTLVFVRTKRDADLLALYLTTKGIKATTINGDRSQHLRELALKQFRKNLVHVLVSTDVCARGIDIKDLDHVINFDLPNDAVTYVHRIGRTGRLKHGRATSFFDENDSNDLNIAKKLVEFVSDVSQEVPDYLMRAAGVGGGFGGGGYYAAAHNQASTGW